MTTESEAFVYNNSLSQFLFFLGACLVDNMVAWPCQAGKLLMATATAY